MFLTLSFLLAQTAFPGAEGHGARATGGRGGDVYHVTNLNDAGEGSLRQGIASARGPRTIVFDVAGNILLRSPLSINRPDLTLAGQTAPAPGVTIAGFTTTISNTRNVIVRYLRFRPGDFNCPAMQGDSLTVDRATDVILDHVSASWSIDETLSVTNSDRVTVQWSFITESLNRSCHLEGDHGFGTLLRYGNGALTFHHNLWAHHRNRSPRLGDNLFLDFVNNVIYDHGGDAGYTGANAEGSPRANYVGNYTIAGPSTTSSRRNRTFTSGGTNTQIYQTGNFTDGNLNAERDGQDTGWAQFVGPVTRVETRFDAPPVTTSAAPEAHDQVLARAGASLYRDGHDERVARQVRAAGGRIINSPREVGGLPAVPPSAPAPPDSDNDGIPDAWELQRGLDKDDPRDGAALTASRYTNLELYLDDLLRPRRATPTRAAIIEETFADGDSQNQDLPNESLRWFNGRAQTLRADRPGAVQFDVTPVGGSSEAFWAFFTNAGAPVKLAPGDRLSATLVFQLDGFAANGQDIRLGLLDSQGTRNAANLTGGQNDASFAGDTGYGAQFFASGTGNPFALGRRAALAGANPFNSFGDFAGVTATGATARQALTDGVPYTLNFTIQRLTPTQTRISLSVSGSHLVGLEASGLESSSTPAESFDYFTFRIGGTNFARQVTLSRFRVEYLPAAPVVISQPRPSRLTLQTGTPITMGVVAEGSDLRYQWQKNGQEIPGANAATYALARTTPGDSGRYTVEIFNAGGIVESDAVLLTVTDGPVAPPPFIVQPPTPETVVTRGGAAALSVVARGDGLVYQWFRNGVALPGATSATLSITNAQVADTGSYRVLVSNPSGTAEAGPARLLVVSPMVARSVSPHPGAAELCIDTPLTITFSSPPRLGNSGRLRVLDAQGGVFDVIDAAVQPATKLIGGVPFNYRPIQIEENTAFIELRRPLAYGQRYSLVVEPGVFLDDAGAPYGGFSDPALWQISTRAQGPAPGETGITVSANNGGHFCGVQAAIDHVPTDNARPVTISVSPGVYRGILYVPASKPFITLRGYDRDATILAGFNNNALNPSTQGRALVGVDANDFRLRDLTLWNTTPRGGSQAEALRSGGRRVLIERAFLRSFQDTILLNGATLVRDSLIEGDVDFLWGSGPAFFQNCELRAVTTGAFYTQVRNAQNQNGFVFVNVRLTAAPGVSGVFLSRIDPGVFPFSQVVFLDSAMGPHVRPEGWQLNNATAAPQVRFWEHRSTTLEGQLLDPAPRAPFSRQLTTAEAAPWRDPAFVLGAGGVPLPDVDQ